MANAIKPPGGEKPSPRRYVYADATDALVFKHSYILDIYNMITDTMLHFKAFVTDYSENFEADYSENRVYGRMDPIFNFKHTTRKINLGFDLPASSAEEAHWNMTKCASMLSMLYPSYGANGGGGATALKSPPMFRLRFANFILSNKLPRSLVMVQNKVLARSATGISNPAALKTLGGNITEIGGAKATSATKANLPDYSPLGEGMGPSNSAISGLPGIIRSLTYAPDMDAGFFDTNPGVLYPKLVKLSFEYNVLHEHSLGWQQTNKGKNLEFRNNVDPKTGNIRPNSRATRDYPFMATGRAAWAVGNAPNIMGAVPTTTAPYNATARQMKAMHLQKNTVRLNSKNVAKGSGLAAQNSVKKALRNA